MELSHYIEVLRRRWWLLLLGPLVAGAVAYSVSESQTDIYQAETTLLINHTETAGILQLDDVLASERLTRTYAELIIQRPILTGVISDLSLTYSVEDLKAEISVEPVVDTQLLRVRVKDADPVLASTIANTLSKDFIKSDPAGLGNPAVVSVAEEASPPTGRVAPRVLLNTSMAIVVGLLVAVAIVVVLESLPNRVSSPDDYLVKSADDMTKLGLMPLAVVPRFHRNGRRNGRQADFVNTVWSNDSTLAEIYRFLRTNVEFATIAHGGQVLLVTSANPLEGKTTTATNLAVAMAKGGRRTVLVDANLRSPALHLQFGVTNHKGLTTLLLADYVDFRDVLCPTEVAGLTLIPSGPLPENVADLLASGGMKRFVECAKKNWDVVILDSPPMNRVADASLLAREADATVLVVEADKTHAQDVTACLESLRRARTADAPSGSDMLSGAWRTTASTPVRTVGAVLNKMTRRDGQFPPYGIES